MLDSKFDSCMNFKYLCQTSSELYKCATIKACIYMLTEWRETCRATHHICILHLIASWMVISFKQSMMLILVVYVSKTIHLCIWWSPTKHECIWLKVSDDSVEPSLPVYTKHTYLCKYQLGPSQSSVVLHTHVGQYVMIEQLPLPDWCEIRSTPSSSFDAKSNIPQSIGWPHRVAGISCMSLPWSRRPCHLFFSIHIYTFKE